VQGDAEPSVCGQLNQAVNPSHFTVSSLSSLNEKRQTELYQYLLFASHGLRYSWFDPLQDFRRPHLE
jgi:hypothetical protein